MEEWKVIQLKEVCELIPGFAFKSSEFGEHDYSVVKIGDIQPPYVREEGLTGVDISRYSKEKLEKFKVYYGDFVLAMTGATIGKIGRYIGTSGAYINQRVLLFRPKENVNKEYIYYCLQTPVFQQYIFNHIDSQTAQPNISAGSVSGFEILLPGISVQNKIANILSALDSKIELNNRINHNLEEQAQALYKSWFVDFEPFKGGKFVDSELGMIPEGWRVGTLSEISSITMGQSPSGTSFNEIGDGIVFYQGRTEFGNRFPSIRLYTTEPARFAEKFSVLLSVRAPVGDINIAKEKCCIGRGLASIHGLFQSFVYYTVGSLKPVLNRFNGEGTVFGSINRKELEGLKIIVPPAIIQEDFNSIVSKYDRDIYDRCSENEALCQLRDSILPKLMSGELKINDLTC